MENINIDEMHKRKIIDETNELIDERNNLALDVLGLSERVGSIGLYQEITAKADDKLLYNKMRKLLSFKRNRLNTLNHKIEVNERILGIKKSKKKKKITRH